MKARARKRPALSKNGMVLRIIKAALFGCVISIVAILLYALTLKWEWLAEGSIPLVTSIIKAVCAALAGFLAANGKQTQTWLWGGLGGIAYILLAFLTFSIIERALALSYGFLADILMGFVAGVAGSMVLQFKRAS